MRTRGWLISLALLSGCATLTPEQVANADYGRYPEKYQEVVNSWASETLKDPDSAKIKFIAGPSKFYRRASIMGGSIFGYGVCVSINAKNSYGGYVGQRRHFFIIRDDKVEAQYGGDGEGIGQGIADGLCQKIGG